MKVTIEEGFKIIEKELLDQGIPFSIQGKGSFATIRAIACNVTAYNPAAKKELTGDAPFFFSVFDGKFSISSSNSRGKLMADQFKSLVADLEITDFVLRTKQRNEFYGAIDEESF